MMTAEQLGISEACRAALVLVLGKMDSGELQYTSARNPTLVPPGENWFNMSWWDTDVFGIHEGCGTVCCIGGWAERLSGVRFIDIVDDPECKKLFHPVEVFPSYDMITVEMAARALRNGDKGLLVARCNQNGQYPWQGQAIIRGLQQNKAAPRGPSTDHSEEARHG